MSKSLQKYTSPGPRYQLVEYEDSYGTAFVIGDSENKDAWVLAETTVDIEP